MRLQPPRDFSRVIVHRQKLLDGPITVPNRDIDLCQARWCTQSRNLPPGAGPLDRFQITTYFLSYIMIDLLPWRNRSIFRVPTANGNDDSL